MRKTWGVWLIGLGVALFASACDDSKDRCANLVFECPNELEEIDGIFRTNGGMNLDCFSSIDINVVLQNQTGSSKTFASIETQLGSENFKDISDHVQDNFPLIGVSDDQVFPLSLAMSIPRGVEEPDQLKIQLKDESDADISSENAPQAAGSFTSIRCNP